MKIAKKKQRDVTEPNKGDSWKNASPVVIPFILLLVVISRGPRIEFFVVAFIYLLFSWMAPWSRRLAYLSVPLLLGGVLYEFFGFALPLRGDIHVADLYRTELTWFGVPSVVGVQTLAEYFTKHNSAVLDVVCGSAYIIYLYETIILALAFFFIDQEVTVRIAWSFLLANFVGMVVWLLYPTAPPWYVQQYGLGSVQLDVPPSAAGAQRFDDILGVTYFQSFYARSTNVFGAMPSLHAAYPTLVFCSLKKRGWFWALITGTFALLVGFSAVYLGHHYCLDVIAGMICGIMSYLAVSRIRTFIFSQNYPNNKPYLRRFDPFPITHAELRDNTLAKK